MLHDIIKGQGSTVSLFTDVLGISKDKPHSVIHLTKLKKCLQLILIIPVTTCTTKKIFFYVKKIKKLYDKYYDTKTVKQFGSFQLPQNNF